MTSTGVPYGTVACVRERAENPVASGIPFDKGADKRKQHGCRGSHVFRDPNGSDRAWAISRGVHGGCTSPGHRGPHRGPYSVPRHLVPQRTTRSRSVRASSPIRHDVREDQREREEHKAEEEIEKEAVSFRLATLAGQNAIKIQTMKNRIEPSHQPDIAMSTLASSSVRALCSSSGARAYERERAVHSR